MANRKLIDNGLGSVGRFPPFIIGQEGLTEQQAAWLSAAMDTYGEALNGQLSLGNGDHATRAGNVHGQWIQQYFPVKDVEVEIPHGLGRKAADVLPGIPDKAARFYTARRGSWTENTIWLACDTDAVTVPLLVI